MVRLMSRVLLSATASLLCSALRAQSPDELIRQVAAAERAGNQADHANWIYFEDLRRSKEHVVQWVAATQAGQVCRVLRKNEQRLPEPAQRDLIQQFLGDTKAQKKQIAENNQDQQQIDAFLKLLPEAFRWTETGSTSVDTSLHFEPDPGFHPPTREARVFSGMAGDLVFDNKHHRILKMSGHLIHDVTFGGGLLGRLKTGSSFSLEQAEVGESLWEMTAIHVHLDGNALLFKSVSLEEDDKRSRYQMEPPTLTPDGAAKVVMTEPDI